MTLETGGKMYLPRQVVGLGQKHSYVGEAEGLVTVVDAPAPGYSNAVPDLETAQNRRDAAQAALDEADRAVALAKAGAKDAKAADNKARTPDDNKSKG